MRLYILGQEIELKSTQIAQTKQVNDIASLETRQANFTPSFDIPPTAKNIRTLNDLGIVGNNSNIPYQKNEAYLYSDSGECFIYKGWAIFTENFKCNIYDGNLEIYKAIENKTLADLDLSALAHSKTLAEVVSTFNDSKPYKYILADYNGNVLYDTNKINIDYLVPSVKASWLMSQIEIFTGFTFNGSFKTDPDYINLWMTYPKGTVADESKTEIYDSVTGLLAGQGLTAGFESFTANEQITISLALSDNIIPNAEQPNFYYVINATVNGEAVLNNVVTLNVGDVLSSTVLVFGEGTIGGTYGIGKINKYNSLNIDFLEELKGMTMRDFFNEIVWRFGLTLFKEKYTNVYNLKTVAEITNPESAIDWSDKFISKESEKYIFGNYAQNNFMRYKYNDENVIYNDGSIIINNANLDYSKTIIQSKIFSPELSDSEAIGFKTKVYKLWDKKQKKGAIWEDGVKTADAITEWLPLANRFYFMRSIDKDFSALAIGSKSLLSSTTVTVAPVESFTGLSFKEIISTHYAETKKILNKSQIATCKLNLKDIDIVDIDFSVLYYFKQLGGNFRLNKVPNFISGRPTNVELIRITQ
jgi:hypothetical protein